MTRSREGWAVEPTGMGCWVWLGHREAEGRPTIHTADGPKYAKRVIYERFKDHLPDGAQLRSICQRADCVNPDHHTVSMPGDDDHLHLPGPSIKAAERLRSRGLSDRAIARILGVSRMTVAKALAPMQVAEASENKAAGGKK